MEMWRTRSILPVGSFKSEHGLMAYMDKQERKERKIGGRRGDGHMLSGGEQLKKARTKKLRVILDF